MIFRVLIFVISALFIAFGASWLSQQEGMTTVTWLGFRGEISSSMAVVLITILCVSVIVIDRMVRALFRWPSLFSAGWQARRRQKGELALSLGFVALAAGDHKAAVKQARRAEKLLEKGILTDLLVAQSSYANGDAKAAGRYFKKLAGEKQTAYFGQLGLMRLHQQDSQNNQKTLPSLAYQAAEKAFALDPTSAEAAQVILQKALLDRHWRKALDCLVVYVNHAGGQSESEIKKAGDLHARLCLQIAQEAAENGEITNAISYSEQALAERPNFAPASHFLISTLIEKKDKRQAQKWALKSFLACPHPLTLASLRKVRDDNDGNFIHFATKQALKSDRPDDGLMAIAQFALSAGIWASASQLLSQLSEDYPRHNEYYMMQAQIAKALEDDEGQQEALEQAAKAPRAGLWQCQQCGDSHASYHFDCPTCEVPAQIHWHWPIGTAS